MLQYPKLWYIIVGERTYQSQEKPRFINGVWSWKLYGLQYFATGTIIIQEK